MSKNVPLNALTTIEMKSVTEAFETIFRKYIIENVKPDDEVDKWLAKLVTLIPLTLMKSEAIETLNNDVFTNEAIRTFVFNLSYKVFAQINESDNFLDKLCVSLKNGLTLGGGELTQIPDVVSQSLVNGIFDDFYLPKRRFIFFEYKKRVSLEEFLKANKHFIIILLICLVSD